MIRAIRAVSSERGRDPREFALFAFGGNGPLFAAGMAAQLDIKRIVVPPCAGLFSSFGLLYADVEYHFSRTFRRILREADPAEIGEAWDALARQAAAQLATDGFTGASAQIKRSAALHYKGQTYELVVPVIDGPIDAAMMSYLEEAFGAEHERTYGHRAGRDEPVELVSMQVIGAGLRKGGGVPERVVVSRPEPVPPPPRPVYFGKERGWIETPVMRRSDLKAASTGPLIVEEYDSTCVIPPDARAELDAGGNIIVEL
jgi:N-methylhydantoinase A